MSDEYLPVPASAPPFLDALELAQHILLWPDEVTYITASGDRVGLWHVMCHGNERVTLPAPLAIVALESKGRHFLYWVCAPEVEAAQYGAVLVLSRSLMVRASMRPPHEHRADWLSLLGQEGVLLAGNPACLPVKFQRTVRLFAGGLRVVPLVPPESAPPADAPMRDIGKLVHEADADIATGPHCWIQWKGTSACMDVHCACGKTSHIDAEFAYTVKCPACGKIWAVHSSVRLTEITEAEASSGHEPIEATP